MKLIRKYKRSIAMFLLATASTIGAAALTTEEQVSGSFLIWSYLVVGVIGLATVFRSDMKRKVGIILAFLMLADYLPAQQQPQPEPPPRTDEGGGILCWVAGIAVLAAGAAVTVWYIKYCRRKQANPPKTPLMKELEEQDGTNAPTASLKCKYCMSCARLAESGTDYEEDSKFRDFELCATVTRDEIEIKSIKPFDGQEFAVDPRQITQKMQSLGLTYAANTTSYSRGFVPCSEFESGIIWDDSGDPVVLGDDIITVTLQETDDLEADTWRDMNRITVPSGTRLTIYTHTDKEHAFWRLKN